MKIEIEPRWLTDGAIVPSQALSEGEKQWLTILGPTAFLLARHLHEQVLYARHRVDLVDVARAFGVPHSKIQSAMIRLTKFGLVINNGDRIVVPMMWPLPSRDALRKALARPQVVSKVQPGGVERDDDE